MSGSSSPNVCQLFVRSSSTVVVSAAFDDTVLAIKKRVKHRTGVPVHYQRLIAGGRQLHDEHTIQAALAHLGQPSQLHGATMHLTHSLMGGKGGFGALLRGAGRAATTTNFDACRTLDGRRLRHVEAAKKQADWVAQEKERHLEKVALQHLKEQEKEERRAARQQVDVKGTLEAQEDAVENARRVVAEALATSAVSPKRKAQLLEQQVERARKMPRRSGMLAVLEGDDASDDSEDEDCISSETAAPQQTAQVAAEAKVASASSPDTSVVTTVPADSTPALVEAEKCKGKEDQIAAKAGSEESGAGTDVGTVELSLYGSAEQLLQAVGPDRIKDELRHVGLKCGGTPLQRAERLFLLKTVPLSKLDAKHRAK